MSSLISYIVKGVVGILIYPVILGSCRYRASVSPINTQTTPIVSELSEETTLSELKETSFIFKQVGVLVALEPGYLGTQMNPILTVGTFKFTKENSCNSLSDNLRMEEAASQTEQGESSLEISDSLDLSSDFSDSDDSIDFSAAIVHEPLDLVILRKQNLLAAFLEDSKNLNSKIYGILRLFDENWVNIYRTSIPQLPDFDSYDNPSFKTPEGEVATSVYFGLRSGTRHLFRKIAQVEGLHTRLEESSRQREGVQEDIETDMRIFCQLLSELDAREQFSYQYLDLEAQRTIQTYFENPSIEIERKRFDVALHKSNEVYITWKAQQFQRDLHYIISKNGHLKRDVIWEIEHNLLQNSHATLQKYQLAIARLRQEIELIEEVHQRNLHLQNGL